MVEESFLDRIRSRIRLISDYLFLMHHLVGKPSNDSYGANQYVTCAGLIKNERIPLRLESKYKQLFKKAAEEAGISLGQWMLGAIEELIEADSVVKRLNLIKYSRENKDDTFTLRLKSEDKRKFQQIADNANLL